jgi:hypothetical protein
MSHGVDHSDHRANTDPRVNRFDFLRFEEPLWRLLCLNPQDYTNRLRHSDYLALFERTGHHVLRERVFRLEDELIEALGHMTLARQFRDKPLRDLATTWSHIVTRRAACDAR